MKTTLQQLQLIYAALFSGQAIFAAVAYFIGSGNPHADSDNSDVFMIVMPAVLVGAISAAFVAYNALKNKTGDQPLDQKIATYRTANIVRWAIVEGANLFACVLLLLTGNPTFLAFFAVGASVFFYFRPSLKGFVADFSLSRDEANAIQRDFAG